MGRSHSLSHRLCRGCLTEEIIRNRFGKPKFEIVGAIKNTEEAASEISGMKPVLEVLRSQIDQDFENLVIDLGQEIITHHLN